MKVPPDQSLQLKDIVITISYVDISDDPVTAYAVSRVYRGDLEGDIDTFIEHIKRSPQIVEFGMCRQ